MQSINEFTDKIVETERNLLEVEYVLDLFSAPRKDLQTGKDFTPAERLLMLQHVDLRMWNAMLNLITTKFSLTSNDMKEGNGG